MEPIGAIDRTLLPADVRAAGREEQSKYAAALQFEEMLVKRMLAEATASEQDADSGSDDELGGGAADAVSNHYREMLPELMAKSVSTSGGLGLARNLYDAMKDRA